MVVRVSVACEPICLYETSLLCLIEGQQGTTRAHAICLLQGAER